MSCINCNEPLKNKWLCCPVCKTEKARCFNCKEPLQHHWICCPNCEADKGNGGIDEEEVKRFRSARKETLAVLQQIIDDLEFYGKIKMTSSVISCGTNIASGLLWAFAPDHNVTIAADIASSGLGIVDTGVSVFSKWKENGLLSKADEICKTDYRMSHRIQLFDKDTSKKLAIQSATFLLKFRNGIKVWEEGKPGEYSFKKKKEEAYVSVLENLPSFLKSSYVLYSGNCSMVAEELKRHLIVLKDEYDKYENF